METLAFNINEIKKEIMRSKAVAKFNHYANGKLYYDIELPSGKYLVPVDVVEENYTLEKETSNEVDVTISKPVRKYNGLKLASDVGNGVFDSEMKAGLLNRWVEKAIKEETFAKL